MIRVDTRVNMKCSWMRAQVEAGMWLGVVLERVTSRTGTGVEGSW